MCTLPRAWKGSRLKVETMTALGVPNGSGRAPPWASSKNCQAPSATSL